MKNFLPLLALVFSLNLAFAQDKVYFSCFEMINVDQGYNYSATKLFKVYSDAHGKYQVILPADFTPESFMPSMEEVQQEAQRLGATYFLSGEINGLQKTLIVSVSLYRTSDGGLVWSDFVKGASLDDLDPVLESLAISMGTKKKALVNEDIYSVTSYDRLELSKKEANSFFGVSVAGLGTRLRNVDENFSSGIGVKLSYDVRDMILDINADMFFGDIDIYNLSLAAIFPFQARQRSPFVGGGLGYGSHKVDFEVLSADYEEDKDQGLSTHVYVGYILSRTSTVQMRATLTGTVATYKINQQTPTGLGFGLAILF
ncbi:hypothetical protein [Marinoscillum sp. MHG1-6]|uniref:hypothetical protein n=1 Tax=Marinoscillum sp. MHG1-6 TaxID=2959627 RepID=UPI0021584ED9|nr:hypothetical protein [Marinoscillum sp. MHG1-6]